MRDKQQKIIDSTEYELYPVSPFLAWEVFQRLSSYGLAPVLKALFAAKEEGKSIMETNVDEAIPKILDAVESVFGKLPEGEMRRLCEQLFGGGKLISKGKAIPNLELHINQYGVMHLLKLVRFGLEVNFSDFLDEFRGKAVAPQEPRVMTSEPAI